MKFTKFFFLGLLFITALSLLLVATSVFGQTNSTTTTTDNNTTNNSTTTTITSTSTTTTSSSTPANVTENTTSTSSSSTPSSSSSTTTTASSSSSTDSTNSTTTVMTTTTSTAPPTWAPPTPAPFNMLSTRLLDMTWYASGAASFFSAIGSMPSAPFGISRGMALISMSECTLDSEELLFPQSLGTFMKVGVKKGEYLRGAMAGNTFLLVVCFCSLYLIGICKREPSDMKERDPFWMQLMNGSRVPSFVAIIYALFLEGTVSAAFKLMKISEKESKGKDIVGFVLTIGFQIGFGIFLFRQLSHVRDKLHPMLYLDSEVRFKDKEKEFDHKESFNAKLSRTLMFGNKAWVPYDEELEDFIPAECRRVYHLMVHYRDRDVIESMVGQLMPNFFFVDAVFTFLVAAMRGNTVPCVKMLWGVSAVSFVAFILILVYRPYQVPIVNYIGALQNLGICFAGLMIQSGIGTVDSGRKYGELAALASAALGFVPTIIVASRHFIMWKTTAFFSRISLSEEDLEAEMKIKERLGIKDIKQEKSDKNVHVGGIYAKTLREQQAEKSTKLLGGSNGSSPMSSLNVNNNSLLTPNASFTKNSMMMMMKGSGRSPLTSQNNNNGSFSGGTYTKSGSFVYVPPKGSADRDTLLDSSSSDDDDRGGGMRRTASSTIENDSRNGDEILKDPHVPTAAKLERLFSSARHESMERERQELLDKAKKERIRKEYGIKDDVEVVSVDSLFGVLTRTSESALRRDRSMLNTTLSRKDDDADVL